MSGSHHSIRVTLAAIALLIILASTLLSVASHQGPSVGAIVFHIEFYDEKGNPLTADLLGRSVTPRDLEVRAQVFAITSPDDPAVIREVYRGLVKGLTLRLEARGLLREVAERWVEFEKRRGPPTRDSETAVQLNLWIVNKTSGEILQRVSYYYTYSPKGLLEGEERVHKVKVAIPKKSGEGQSEAKTKPYIEPYIASGPCAGGTWWEPKYKVVPENYTQAYGEHITYRYGTWYVRTPLLTVYNRYPASSPITAGLTLAAESKSWFYVAAGIGFEIEAKLKSGDVTGGLDGKVYLAGRSREDKVSFGAIISLVQPLEEAYIWIWTRPVMILYDEYTVDCLCYTYRTGNQKIEFFIQDYVKWYDSQVGVYRPEGGVRREPLPSFIRNWLFNDTLSEWKYVYRLDPGQGVRLGDLIQSFDTCQADFEISLGPLLATVIFKNPKVAHLVSLAVQIDPGLSWGESETRYVGGVVYNEGSYVEYLYFRISKLSYKKDPPWWCFWCSPCYYKVPVSIYIDSR